MNATKLLLVLLMAVLSVAMVSPALADPLAGEVLKFQQRPMIAAPIPNAEGVVTTYYGHDEESTAYGSHLQGQYTGWYMADDFADKVNTPVVHLKWWGSYLSQPKDVQKFLVAFESDVPDPDGPHYAPGSGFSHPGTNLLAQVVNRGALAPASGTFTEKPVPGSSPTEPVYEYNAELQIPFNQQPNTVYWLKVVALVDPTREGNIVWGWHNRDYRFFDPLAAGPPIPFPGEHNDRPIIDPGYPTDVWHFQDDSVMGNLGVFVLPTTGDIIVEQTDPHPMFYVNDVDGPGPQTFPPPGHGGIGQFSKDLAFELYTVPEPGTLVLLVTAGLGLLAYAWRRRRS